MRIINIAIVLVAAVLLFVILPTLSFSREIILYSFEKDPQGWEVPDWALGKKDHVAEGIGISEFQASAGSYALEVSVNFISEPGWRGAYVERVVDITDWSPFKYLSADVFLPKDAPRGLRARIILTVGNEWKWTEANKSVALIPGEWSVVKVDLSQESLNWRRFISEEFRGDVKKMGVRIESNGNIAYKGPVYIDNIKLSD